MSGHAEGRGRSAVPCPRRARYAALALAGLVLGTRWAAADPAAPNSAGLPTWRGDAPPRKVLVGTEASGYDVVQTFPLEMRLRRMDELVDAMEAQAKLDYPGKRLDLAVLTEYFLARPGDTLAETAVRLDDVRARISACAEKHACYLIVPMILREEGAPVRYTNVAALLDRKGGLVGMYRKVHPVSDLKFQLLEGGMAPGRDFPVFDCDFGRVGIQICYDIFYPDGWAALARQGAEIVALPSGTPETIRPLMYAQQHRYYIVSATPRDHAAVYSPLGKIEAETTQEGVMVHQIDLSFAIVKWEQGLDAGKGLTRRFGDRVGYHYYGDEDAGIFWSNDPALPIGRMLESLGFPDMDRETERNRLLQDSLRGGPPVAP
jgi:predicted amidohydrolase